TPAMTVLMRRGRIPGLEWRGSCALSAALLWSGAFFIIGPPPRYRSTAHQLRRQATAGDGWAALPGECRTSARHGTALLAGFAALSWPWRPVLRSCMNVGT